MSKSNLYPGFTVEELINELQKIKDKNSTILVDDIEYGFRLTSNVDNKVTVFHIIDYCDVFQCNEQDTCPYCVQGNKQLNGILLS